MIWLAARIRDQRNPNALTPLWTLTPSGSRIQSLLETLLRGRQGCCPSNCAVKSGLPGRPMVSVSFRTTSNLEEA